MNGHTVTLDATGLECLSLTISSGATVNASASASSTLTSQNVITVKNGGTWDTDVSSNAAIVCTIVLNGAGANAPLAFRGNNQTAKISMKGASRKRITTLTAAVSAGATSASVVDSAGWRTGDTVCFVSTTPSNPLATETKVVTVSGTSITWTGGLTYAYQSGGYVGNLSGNMVVTSAINTEAANGGIYIECQQEPVTKPKYFSNVQFLNLGVQGYQGGLFFSNSYWQSDSVTGIVDCAFFGAWGTGVGCENVLMTFPMERCVFWSGNDHSITSWNQHLRIGGSQKASQVKDCLFGRNVYGVAVTGAGVGAWEFDSNIFSGGRFTGQFPYVRVTNSDFISLGSGNYGISYLENCNLGVSFGEVRANPLFNIQDMAKVTLKDCYLPAASTSILSTYWVTSLSTVGAPDSARLTIVNRDKDPTKQAIYTNFSYDVPTYIRENSVAYRSSSSFKFNVQKLSYSRPYSFTVPCAAGASVRLIGYVRRTLTSIAATVTVSGLGITPVVYTNAAAANTWEKWDITVTNSSGGDGQFTVSYDATDVASTAGSVYFDGVPDSPFVTKCRHYGFTFDEANPVRTVNTVTVASEATAAAYTGVAINSATPQITVGAGTANTFQKVYDYIQAWACLNVDKAVLFTSTDGNNFAVPLTCKVSWPGMGNDGTLSGGWLLLSTPGTLNYKLSGTKVEFQTAGNYDMGGTAFSGTVEFVNTSGGAVTVAVPAGTSYTNTGPSITVTAPTVTQGLNFTGLVAGSQVVVYATGSTTELFRDNASATAETWSQAGGSGLTVDYTIFKDGYLPLRVTGITVNSAVVGVPVQQSTDPAYVTPSGLTWGSTATVNVAGKTFAISAATTGQNWYSFMVQQWRQQATLQNVAFPLTTNGPNSVRLANGWEFSGGLSNWTRDGLAYFDTSSVRTAAWAAVLTSGTTAGHQVRYLQSDGGAFADAANTGPMDQLVQVYGDASHGNFDRTGFLVVKIQKEGFDQAEADIYGTYGALEDQLYVVGLQAVPNSVAASATARTIAITDSPVTWNSKVFSLTIDATGLTGAQLMQWLRYSFAQAGIFQSKPTFNWHDLVQTNGAKFKTVRGVIHGDASAALKGVRVLASGAAHPDFDTFTADDGTTYSPPVTQSFTVDGLVSGSYVQIYDVTNAVQLAIGTSTTSFTWTDSGAATGNRQIRLRVAYCSGASAKEFIEVANAGTCGTTVATANKTYTVAQVDDAVYNAIAIAGSSVTGIAISDAVDRMQINIAGGTVSWRSIYAYNVYWLSTAAGIVDDGSIITAKDQANYSVTLFKIKNTGATPLKITQGWGVDSTTGSVEDIIDTTGGNIYPVVDHVVSSVVSVGGANIITGDIADIPAAVWAHTIP